MFNLVDDIISDVNDDVISDITDDVIMHDVISDVSHHTAPKTNISHPHPPGQATQIQTAVHTRWLSKLTCRWHATRGGPVGFSRHPQMLFSNTQWWYPTSNSTKAEVIAQIILSTTFWKLLSSCPTLLQPLARMIRKADTEGSTYNSLVYYEMLLFQQHVAEHQGPPKPEHKQAKSLVLERWKFLHHPVHSASYVLNPALMTREEDPLKDCEIRNDVAQVFESFGGKEHAQTAKLQLQQFPMSCGEFADERLWTKESLALGGLNWFQAFCNENSVLRDIALRVHSTPTVASAAERNWSVFGFVHSKSRKRLYGHKVEKVVYIYQNMRLLRKIRDPAFREPCVLPDHMFDEDEEEEE